MEEKEKTEEEPEAEKPEEAVDVVAEAKKASAEMKASLEERRKLVEREEKVLDRKEALNALGGGSPRGEPVKPSLSAEEKASREKIKAVGLATGAQWAKDMDKEDGKK